MGQYESYLREFDQGYDVAEEVGFTELPDGKYQARIERAAIEPNKNTSELMLIWEFEVATGEYQGKMVRKRNMIKDETLSFIKTDFSRLNIQLERFSMLEGYLPEALDLIVDIELKHGRPNDEGKSYQNIYINKVVGKANTATTKPATPKKTKPSAKKAEASFSGIIPDEDLPF